VNAKPTDEQIAAALLSAMGQVSRAAEKLDCSIDWIYRRAGRSRRVRRTLRLYRGKLLDLAERAIWQALIDHESWAVKLCFDLWGRSRDFTDGGESWHAPGSADEKIRPELVRQLAEELMKDERFTETARTGESHSHTGLLCLTHERRDMANGAAPGGDRPGDHRHDQGAIGADSDH
jgi:hypothetical protein